MTHEEAVAKVAKLLRLAQSDNPNEAALAAARAQELMDRFKIEGITADFDPNAAKPEPEEPIVNFSEPLEAKQSSTWLTRIALALAAANQCRVYKMAGKTCIVGRPSDVQTVRYLYNFLKAEVNRLANRDGRGYSNVWKNNFRLGASDTIVQKIRASREELKRTMKSEADVSRNPNAIMRLETGLARIEARSKSVDQWINTNMRMKSYRASHGQQDYGARAAGQKAGHEINLNSHGSLGSGQKKLDK